ncbi:hypothetical protein VPH35_090300 [Triticum aestivum]
MATMSDHELLRRCGRPAARLGWTLQRPVSVSAGPTRSRRQGTDRGPQRTTAKQTQGEHLDLGRAGVRRPRAGAHQRAAGHGGFCDCARRGSRPWRRAPLAARQRHRAGVVRLLRGGAVRGVAGAAAPGREHRGQSRRHHERQRGALERPLRHARPRRARRHRDHHWRALHQRVE